MNIVKPNLLILLICLLVYTDYSCGAGPCYRDNDCPKLNMKCRMNSTAGGVCECMDGWIPWKWECHPHSELGQPCVTSLQCLAKNENSMCNPMNGMCSCERGYTPTRSTEEDDIPTTTTTLEEVVFVEDGSREKLVEESKARSGLICVADKVYMSGSDDVIAVHSPDKLLARPRHHPNQDAIQSAVQHAVRTHHKALFSDSMILLGLIILGLSIAGIATALYVKAVQEKKMSQAAVRSLLTLISENEGLDQMKRTYTSDSLKTHNTDVESGEEKQGKQSFATGNLQGEFNDSFADFPTPDIEKSLPSKLTLAPLEVEGIVKFPAPHLSHAALPPIKSGKPTKPNPNDEQIQDGDEDSPSSANPPNTFESLNVGPTSPVEGDPKELKSLPCGFENNFVEKMPGRTDNVDDLSNLPLQTLSFRNLSQMSYQNNINTVEMPKSAASFPDDDPPKYDDLLT